MTMPEVSDPASKRATGALLACGVSVTQLVAISLLYQHGFEFTCRDVLPEGFCAFAGRIVPRTLAVTAMVLLFALANRRDVAALFATAGESVRGLLLNFTGFALILAPWFLVSDASGPALVTGAALSWSFGGLLAVAGLAIMIAPLDAWTQLFKRHWIALSLILPIGLAMPEISDMLYPLWRIEGVTEFTYIFVLKILAFLGYEMLWDLPSKTIGTEDWAIAIGPQCSGVEGFMLITVFLTLYITLFRKDLHFPTVFILYPIGILLSGTFNIIRIVVLIIIGVEGNPELAIGGFHSHAGWLSFTTLALIFIFIASHEPALQRELPGEGPTEAPKRRSLPPFLQDPAVVQILPFIVFMASALVVSTLSEMPSVHYPWRAAAMAAGLALVWPALRALPWRIDPLSVGVGVLIGAGWIATGASEGDAPFGALAGGALVLWFIARIVGTAVFVPVIEELFFRKYLLDRFAPDGTGWRMLIAVLITSGLFALLHDRWIEAGIAGVLFAALVWRSRNITDAIVSHAVANAMIAAYAFAFGAWHIL